MQPDPQQLGGQLGLNMQQPQQAAQYQQQQAGMVRDLRAWTPGQQAAPGGAHLTMQQLQPQMLLQQQQQQQPHPGMFMQPPGPGMAPAGTSGPAGPHGMPQPPPAAAPPPPPPPPAPQYPSTAQPKASSRWDAPGPATGKRTQWDAPSSGRSSSSRSSGGGAQPPPPPQPPPGGPQQQLQQQHQRQQPPPPPPPGGPGNQQHQKQQPVPPPAPPPWHQHQQQPPPPPGHSQQQPPPPSGHGRQQPPPPQQQQQPPPPPPPPPVAQRQQQQQLNQQQQQPRQPRRKKQRQQQQQQQKQQQEQPPPPPPGGQVPGPLPGMQQPQQPLHPGAPVLQGAAAPVPLPPGAQPILVQGQGPPAPSPGVQYVMQQQQPGQQPVLVYVPGGALGIGAPGMAGVGPPQGQQPGGGMAAAGGPPGAPPPPPPVMPTMAVLLQAAGSRVQDLFLVLAELPRFLAATHASTLQEQDTAQVCQALLAALPGEGTLPQPLLNSPGIKTWYSTLRRAQPQLSAAQQLQVLECLAAMVRAGCEGVPTDLADALAASVAGSSLMSDCAQFEAAAQALMVLSSKAAQPLLPCFERMLADSVLRKVLKEDADQGCGVLIAVLVGLGREKVALSQKLQESVSKFLQDALPRLSSPTLAGLLACHTSLGLGSTTKLLRRAATEYQRRPEASPSVEMLLGIMAGLVAGGRDFIRDLPQQLLTRLTDDLHGLLSKLQGPQLLKAISLLAQLGCIRSSKQQQFVDQLLQHLAQQQLQPEVLLQLPELTNSLADMEAAQSQPGLGALVKKLHGVQDSRGAALQEAAAVDVLRLALGLQQQGKLQEGQQVLPELPAKVLASIQQLAEAVAAASAAATSAAAAAAAAEPEAQAEAVGEGMRLEQEQKQLLRVLSFQEWVSVIQVVRQSFSSAGSPASILMPTGGEEVALLLQAMIDSELLHFRVQQVPAVAPPPPAPDSKQQQEPPRSAANGRATPPVGAAGSDGGSGAPDKQQTMLLPMVFVAADWEQLALLLHECLEWYPLDLLPEQLLLLALEVLEAQAALGGMTTCSTASAVQMLWCLGIAGGLSYELWDLLSGPLDSVTDPLHSDQLTRVFEAYCLAVLRNSGPTPCEILMPQLVQAGQQFGTKVLKANRAARDKLHQALLNAGLVGENARPTRVADGHMMLCDVCVTEHKQAWVVAGVRGPLLSAAAGRLLSAAGWVQLQLSAKELERTSSNPQSQAQRLVQLSQVAGLLPRLSAMIRDHTAKQQLKQQQKADGQGGKPDNDSDSDSDSDELDEDDMQQLVQLVQYLTASLASGTLLQPLQDKQMAYLQHIAEQYTGQVQQQLPELPALGSTRAARQQRQQEAVAAALAALQRQQRQKGPPWALDESAIDLSTVPPNSIGIQDVFALNRNGPAGAAQDPGWYGLRLLALPPDVKEGTPAAAAAAAAETASQAAAAAAAFVINCRQAKAEAAAAAAWAAAAAEAAAAARALQQQQEGELEEGGLMDADGAEWDRGRSPTRAAAKRRRHWRDSRSRSRSCSQDSATSTSTRDSSSSSGRSGSSGRNGRRRAAAGEGGSDSEEGALSEQGSEEGQVPEAGADEWARAYWDRRQSRASADAPDSGVGSMAPVSFAARGMRQPQYKQQQHQQKQPLKRGRPRSRSRSQDSWDRGRQHKQQYGQYRRSSGGSDRSRSRSPAGSGGSPSSPASKRHTGAWDTNSSAAAAAAASAGYGASAGSAAMAAAAAGYGMSGYGMGMAALLQQQQAVMLAAAAAKQQQQHHHQHQHHFDGPKGQEKLMGLFSHMPAVQARLAELLQEGWFAPYDVKHSAVVLMLQLDEAKLLSVLTELRSTLAMREDKARRKQQYQQHLQQQVHTGGPAGAASSGVAAAGGAAAGPQAEAGDAAAHRLRPAGGEVNGWLVMLCKRMGAKAPPKASAAAAGAGSLAASAAAMRGMQGMYAGWSSYMAAAAAAAAGGGGGSSGATGGAAAAGKAAAAAAAGKASGSAAAGAYGGVGGYMLVNGMLVPVPAQTAAALAARQGAYSFGGLAAAAGTSPGGSTAAESSAAGAAAAAAGDAAAGGAGEGQGKGAAKQERSAYWDALYSGLDADLDGDGVGGGATKEAAAGGGGGQEAAQEGGGEAAGS